ncbi:DUF551 domain-containing protein [Acinetobacter baumannii]|uniref:DUF551 domain-containing protein n=1 Tax=Acinetobacter baumannii TaxID=470 RepID=UPI0037D758BF
MEWIRVEDRLPEYDGNVICFDGTWRECFFVNGYFYVTSYDKDGVLDLWFLKPTHWFRPEPPKN